jgi:amino acid transporter
MVRFRSLKCRVRPHAELLITNRFGWVILIAAELVAITHMFRFVYPPNLLKEAGYPDATLSYAPQIAPGVIILIFIWIILLLNLVPVKQFGQMEYIFGSIKMIFVIMMILFNTIIHSLHRVKSQQGFWTYNAPYGGFAQNITLADGLTVIGGGGGRLAGVW